MYQIKNDGSFTGKNLVFQDFVVHASCAQPAASNKNQWRRKPQCYNVQTQMVIIAQKISARTVQWVKCFATFARASPLSEKKASKP